MKIKPRITPFNYFRFSFNRNNQKQRIIGGFAILYAVLTSSLLLMVGLSIFNLSLKELTIGSFNNESKRAMYAAQSGIECFEHLYADNIINMDIKGDFIFSGAPKTCGAGLFDEQSIPGLPGVLKSKENNSLVIFWFGLDGDTTPDVNGPCVMVKATRGDIRDYGTSVELTILVNSVGYNSCNIDGNNRIAERSYDFSIKKIIYR